ncbi:MAG: NRPS-like enzyme [Lasallia pustulata]|uniref:NRPS-like enzyme n=1 Tax=Lasallia pustulata TaxID=136370 RepID=A0A5M8PS75_9LECA|nr:MAG: NRPS-like enzyme [Lasallia pustulata]
MAGTSFVRARIDLEASESQKNGIRTVPELLEFNAKTNPHHLFCVQARKHANASDSAFLNVTHAQLAQAVLRCSAWLTENVAELCLPYKNDVGQAVRGSPVALFVNSNVGLLIHKIGLMCLGVPVLLLSARLSPAAISHLLLKTAAKAIIVSPRLRATVTEALSLYGLSNNPPALYIQHPYETFLSSENSGILLEDNICGPNHFISEDDRNVLILHSSGTTGLPKPIYTSHRHLLGFTACHDFQNEDEAHSLSLSTLPLYHGFGLVTPCLSFGVGMPFCLPVSSTISTGFSTVDLLKRSEAKALLTVPSILEEILLLPDGEGVLALKPLQFVTFGGGLLKASVGDKLETLGVRLLNHYGTTETGPLAPIFVPTPDYDWHYFRLRSDIRKPLELRLEPSPPLKDEVQHYKLSLRPFGWKEHFEVQDQLISNPHKPGSDYSAVGRNDDVIVLATGEKVNPRILESMLSESEMVKAAVAFGDGQFEIGVIVEPIEHLATIQINNFKSLIWPIIQRASRQMDAQSQLSSKDAIVVVPPGSIPRADKGTVLRQEAYTVFGKEIAEAYATIDTTISSLPPLDMTAIEQGLKDLIQTRLNWKVPDGEWTYADDFFELGMDSLQAIQLRRLILASLPLPGGRSQTGLQGTTAAAVQFPRDFVYQYPSIAKMAYALKGVSGDIPARLKISHDNDNISKLVELYSIKGPVDAGLQRRTRHVVLLTGSTGSLGSYVLADLANAPTVARVICINRSSSSNQNTNPYTRQDEALKAKGITLSKSAWAKIRIHETNSAAPRLGLQDVEYTHLQKQITHILHNAWPMDFNRRLPSFGAQFQALQNLLNLARETHAVNPLIRPKVIFVSSISVVGLYQHVCNEHIVSEIPIHDDNCTIQLGYSKAKLVCEMIMEKASHDYPTELEAAYVRFGQISGAQCNGYWNSDEHIAALIKSSQKIGKLPCLRGTHSWLPVDCAAHAVSELLLDTNCLELVYHMENPVRQSWRDTLEVLGARLNLSDADYIPFSKWLEKVCASTDDGNPAKNLAEFFANDFERMSGGSLILSTEKARKVSSTLRMMAVVSKQTTEAYIDRWKTAGFLA